MMKASYLHVGDFSGGGLEVPVQTTELHLSEKFKF
jgi:hypothetical protein